MAAVNFPSNPTEGQQFTPYDSNVVYTWTGTFWDVYTALATFPRATSASYAESASIADNGGGGGNSLSASFASSSLTASYLDGTASLAETSSYAVTASYVIGGASVESSSYAAFAVTASYIKTASYANSAYYAIEAISSSYVTVTQSAVTSASWASQSLSASYAIAALTASYIEVAKTASYSATSSWAVDAITASYVSGSNVVGDVSSSRTSSISDTAYTASYVLNAVSSSYARSASFAQVAVTFTGTASYAATSSWALNANTASFATTARGLDIPLNISTSYEVHVSSGSGNDTTGDGTFVRPYKTVQKALNVISSSKLFEAIPSPTVYVHPGAYPESVTISYPSVKITALIPNLGTVNNTQDIVPYKTDVYIDFITILDKFQTGSSGNTHMLSNLTVGSINKSALATNVASPIVLNNVKAGTVNLPSYDTVQNSILNSQILTLNPFGDGNASTLFNNGKLFVKNSQITKIFVSKSASPSSYDATAKLEFDNCEIGAVNATNVSMTILNSKINAPFNWTGSGGSQLYIVNTPVFTKASPTSPTGSLGTITAIGSYTLQNVAYNPSGSLLSYTASAEQFDYRTYFKQASFEGITGSFQGFITSASYAAAAQTANQVNGSGVVGTVSSATTATTATAAQSAVSASFATTSTSASYALTASYALNGGGGGSTTTRILSGSLRVYLNVGTYYGTHSWSTDYLNVVLYRKDNTTVTSSLIAQNEYVVRTYANSKVYLETPYASNATTYSFFITPVV